MPELNLHVLLPEFVYVRDLFGTRMNTVFKLYYQGWLLLGIGSAYGIAMVTELVTRYDLDAVFMYQAHTELC